MTATRSNRGLPVGQTIATVLAVALLAGLGTWQLKRLAWKEDLLAKVAALQTAPSRPIGPVLDRLAAGEDVGFTRVTAVCPGLASAPFLDLYGLRGGEAGSRLISACMTASGRYRSILVDRGYVPDTVSARPRVDPADHAPLTMTGVLRAPDRATFVTPANQPQDNHWYSRDVPAMAKALGAPDSAPVMLMAETSTNPQWKALIPAPIPADIPNRHLEYALTWFGLAGSLLAVYAAAVWRRWKS